MLAVRSRPRGSVAGRFRTASGSASSGPAATRRPAPRCPRRSRWTGRPA